MIRFVAVAMLLLLPLKAVLGQTASQPVDYTAAWNKFNETAERVCPSHHIDFLSDGQYDDVLEDFLKRYPKNFQDRIARLVDYPKTCARETAGFTCEFLAHLVVFQQLGLFQNFIGHSCAHWRCQEPSLCDEIKSHR